MPVLNRIADYADEMKGWRRHLHLGLARDDHDLLSAELGAGATAPCRPGEVS